MNKKLLIKKFISFLFLNFIILSHFIQQNLLNEKIFLCVLHLKPVSRFRFK